MAVQINLQLDTDSIALILEALGAMPHDRVAPLYRSLSEGTASYLRGMDAARLESQRAAIEKQVRDDLAPKEVPANSVATVRKAKRVARSQKQES